MLANQFVGQKVGVMDCLHELVRCNEALLQELDHELISPLLDEAIRNRVTKYHCVLSIWKHLPALTKPPRPPGL